ncbi:hyaluronan-binding protein 2-like [Polymixia lowei]
MLSSVALLISLSVLTVHGQDPDLESMYYVDYGYDYTTETASGTVPVLDDWLYDFIDDSSTCDPNPCLNGGSCEPGSNSDFICSCPEPYTGKKCQRVKNICQDAKCGMGDCLVNLKKPPFYECKCKPPYQGPDCKSLPKSACDPNPCKNGAACIKGNNRFRCACPDGYTGRFCETAPNDCYEGNGETYTGAVSVTEAGDDCLDWSSYFIMANGEDPFTTYEGFSGLGSHNQCRNPDGEERPWCFVKRKGKLEWDYCKVRKCSAGGSVPATPPPTTVKPDTGAAQFSQCGKPQPGRLSRIYGGSKTTPGAHPWQVSLQSRPQGSPLEFSHDCGGILIQSCWVLTAAHCILPNVEHQVVLGGVNIDKKEVMDQTIPVIKTIVHENYRETINGLYNDIALLQLKVTDSPYCAKETRFVKTACLPDQRFPDGKECVISGWGATKNQKYSSQLLNARIRLISQERCKAPNVYGDILDDSMFCAGKMQGGTDSCQGDSGGPLVCDQNGTHYVSGVVSWGEGCGHKNKPGVYANVLNFNNWIRSKIN